MAAELVELFESKARANGFVVHRGGVPELEGAGVSRALYGIAETGSVVFAATPEEPRSASLFPEVHLTLLESERILPGLDELFAAVGDSLPSSLALVSGPSRSADIELILALGVHGPREVHVAVLDPGANE